MPRFRSTAEAADHFKVSTRTILNWHEVGYITGFRASTGVIKYDIDEIEYALQRHSRAQMRDGRRRGPLGRIVPMPVTAEVAE